MPFTDIIGIKWYSEEEVKEAIGDIEKYMISLAYQKKGKKLVRVDINHLMIMDKLDKAFDVLEGCIEFDGDGVELKRKARGKDWGIE